MILDPIVLLAIIDHESSFDPKAFAPDKNGGSYGLMQLDWQTAKDRGFAGISPTALDDPILNLRYGVAVLMWIGADLERHGKLTFYNLCAAYNSGLQHVLDGGTDDAYVSLVKGRYDLLNAALGLCLPRGAPLPDGKAA